MPQQLVVPLKLNLRKQTDAEALADCGPCNGCIFNHTDCPASVLGDVNCFPMPEGKHQIWEIATCQN